MKKREENLCKRIIDKYMKTYLLPKRICPEKVNANRKIAQINYQVNSIINGQTHPTNKIAKIVEHDFRKMAETCQPMLKT